MRLSGRSEDDLVEQLIWRTIGPDPRKDRRRSAVLQWAGIRAPYAFAREIADEHSVTRQMVDRWVNDTIDAAPDVDLTLHQLALLAAPTVPRQDRRLRARRARLFHRPPPPPLPSNTTHGWRRWNDVAVRITAALGPLTTPQIHSAILDARRGRGRRITVEEVAQALDGQGALTRTEDGRWQPATPTAPLLIDVALIAMVRAEKSQPIPYQRMREIMVALGLNPLGSGGGPVMYYHPLAYSVSYGRWALRDHPTSVARFTGQSVRDL